MSEKTYQISQDSHNRLCAEIAEGVTVGFQVLDKNDWRYINRNERAYVVLDIETPLGRIRIRDVRLLRSATRGCFFLRWKQWKTGKFREGRPEYLDVAGPHNREGRDLFSAAILAVFEQLRKELQLADAGDPELKASVDQSGPSDEGQDGPAEVSLD